MPPMLMPVRPASGTETDDTIHVVSRFCQASGGTEWHALNLARQLALHHPDVRVWSDDWEFDPVFRATGEIRQVRHALGRFPRRGTLIVVGGWFKLQPWARLFRARRVIRVITICEPQHEPRVGRSLHHLGRPVEHVFICKAQRRLYGLEGVLHPPPVNPAQFTLRQPAVRPDQFIVGRLSRDVVEKHDFVDDPDLYQWLIDRGASVRLMGATRVARTLPQHPRMTALPAMAEPAPQFLHSLDCFFYRTAGWFDTFALVVFEAMACGLPVVLHRWGGYTDYLTPGVDSFVFDSQAEAQAILARLQDEPALRERVGRAARATVERMYAPDAVARRAAFYLAPSAQAAHALTEPVGAAST